MPSLVAERGAERSDLAFCDALRALMGDLEVSGVRQLAELTDGGLRSARVGYLVSGHRAPTVENIVLLAQALGVDPSYFREYREHLAVQAARDAVRVHGADVVLNKLDELN